ncbi:putative oxidoreductase [Lunatimonas lonarensis]|uniref:Putative oxidoreductase n=1 Tax=Lunatimonas lonarensis TaxID=1232681 RepID=R7ZLR0_9BACT|nr:SDR family NAD(P)-dependent oxidoreductase [Lunatimonas lonarensis]EON75031.1 putative oxidoreductase [Lunatimonas lonarensis]
MAKSILVTGGTKGIGKAILFRFAAEGFDVYTCARKADQLEQLTKELNEVFPTIRVLARQADLSLKSDAVRFAEEVKDLVIPDVVVNNTGIFLPGALHNEPEGNFETTLQTNLFSAYYITRAFTPDFIHRKSGHIFSIGSIAGLTAYPNGGSYAVSKWAMLGFTKCLRQELMPYGIRVTSVLPGATLTASWEGVDLPPDRFMKASDVADAVWGAYNLSPQSVVEEIVIRPQLGDI